MAAATCFKVPILLQNTTGIYKWVIMTSLLEWVNYQIFNGKGACKLIEDVQAIKNWMVRRLGNEATSHKQAVNFPKIMSTVGPLYNGHLWGPKFRPL